MAGNATTTWAKHFQYPPFIDPAARFFVRRRPHSIAACTISSSFPLLHAVNPPVSPKHLSFAFFCFQYPTIKSPIIQTLRSIPYPPNLCSTRYSLFFFCVVCCCAVYPVPPVPAWHMSTYNLQSTRPRPPPPPLRLHKSALKQSSATVDNQLLYDLPTSLSTPPPDGPTSFQALISPTSPTSAGRSRARAGGRHRTPPPRNRSSTPQPLPDEELDQFASNCRSWCVTSSPNTCSDIFTHHIIIIIYPIVLSVRIGIMIRTKKQAVGSPRR